VPFNLSDRLANIFAKFLLVGVVSQTLVISNALNVHDLYAPTRGEGLKYILFREIYPI